MTGAERLLPPGLPGAGALAALLLAAAGTVSAQIAPSGPAGNYPAKVVRLIVANAPGGGADLVGRVLSDKLARPLGRQIIVENRPGASGQIGADYVAKAPPDGYTLLLGTTLTLISSPALHPNLPYKSPADFAPISLLASTTYALIVHPSVPARSARDLAALAKGRRGGLNYASPGPGSAAHIAAEMLGHMIGVKLTHVTYRGALPGVLSVVQGETDLMFANLLPAMPLIKSGRVRALGIASLTRSSLLPELRTLHESGLPGFDVQQYYSLVAPAGTSGEIVGRLNEEISRHFQAPDVKSRLAADGSEVRVSTPAELEKLIISEIAKWSQAIKRAGIKSDQVQ
jgi:tripartite-type tricarboxylate transporter receptor subunit TctC